MGKLPREIEASAAALRDSFPSTLSLSIALDSNHVSQPYTNVAPFDREMAPHSTTYGNRDIRDLLF